MEDKFYSVESCNKLTCDLNEFTDTFKYLMNLPQNNPDNTFLTPELLEAFREVVGAAEEMIAAYKYYSEKKHYLAKDENELREMCRKP